MSRSIGTEYVLENRVTFANVPGLYGIATYKAASDPEGSLFVRDEGVAPTSRILLRG